MWRATRLVTVFGLFGTMGFVVACGDDTAPTPSAAEARAALQTCMSAMHCEAAYDSGTAAGNDSPVCAALGAADQPAGSDPVTTPDGDATVQCEVRGTTCTCLTPEETRRLRAAQSAHRGCHLLGGLRVCISEP